MTQIGTFMKTENGWRGTIRTLTVNVKAALVANNARNGNDKAPDFKLVADGKEFGAAWRAVGKGEGGRPFLRVELDDPSFSAPVRAALFEDGEDGKGVLVWSRR